MSLVSSMLGDLTEGFRLPITRRGLFSKDDFFKGFQKDYGHAVDDVLSRWGARRTLGDRIASYRRLREKDTSEDSQAASISETEDKYLIALDMSAYASGSITVQTVQCSAVVEGRAGGRTYTRRFPLPADTNIDGVVADLSDESILTITAPRKGKKTSTAVKPGLKATIDSTSIESQILPSEGTTTKASASISEREIPLVIEGKSGTAQTVKTEETSQSTAGGSSSTRIIPLNIEGDTTTTGSSQTTSTKVSSETGTTQRVIPTVREDEISPSSASQTSSSFSSTTTSAQGRVLPITKRGRFFQDASFESAWKDFEAAIDDMVTRRGSRAGLEQDNLSSYRNLRDVVQQDDNQAAAVSKESGEYKIVVDVKDFVEGHLDVKAHQGSILVTGQKGSYSFERRFSLPGLTQPDKVVASLSTDGVLTITAPK